MSQEHRERWPVWNLFVLIEICNPVEFLKGPVYLFFNVFVWLYNTTSSVTNWQGLEMYNYMKMIFRNYHLEFYMVVLRISIKYQAFK